MRKLEGCVDDSDRVKMAEFSRSRGSCAEEMARDANTASAATNSSPAPRAVSPEQDYDFVQDPPNDFYCTVSMELLLEPHQTGCCGHHLSRAVVERLKRERKPCPMCQNRDFPTHADLYLRRKVRELQVRCQYREGGCEWVGELGNRDAHQRTCPKQPWQCQHCTFCGLRETSEAHTQSCLQVPVQCPNRCNVVQVPRCELSNHLECVCPLQPVPCPYSHVGCKAVLTRSERDVHVQHSEQAHLLLTCSANLDLTRQLNEKISQNEAQIEALKAEVVQMGRGLGGRVQAVEATLAVQGEWMESQHQQPETLRPPPAEDDERAVTEESVRKAVASEMEGLEKKLVEAFGKEMEQNSATQGNNLTGMMEQQAQAMRALEEKLDRVVTGIQADHRMVMEGAKNQEKVLVEMLGRQDTVLKEDGEQNRELVKEVEKNVVKQVKTSQKHVETVVAREREVGREEMKRELVALRGSVEEKAKGVEGVISTVEQKITAKLRDLEAQFPATKNTEEAKTPVRETVMVVAKKAVELGRDGPDKPTSSSPPKVHRHHRVKQTTSHPLPISEPSLSKPDKDDQKLIQHEAKNEDANRRQTTRVASQPSLPQTVLPVTLLPGQHHLYFPPCEFKVEQFSKLKEQNKEWRSPPFYSREGYKMCLGLWPNGFRSGSGTHVSVEFYKMRDVNTDRLKWNVKLPIHVRIYNYRTKKWERDHINGETFARSKVSGEYETSGYAQSHKLIAHDELDNYLLDDNFRIQIYKFEVKQ